MIAVLALPAMAQATDELTEVQVSQAVGAPVEPAAASPAEEVGAEAAAEDGEEEIVVVGSRIRRDTYNSASPIQVITREESTLAGYNSTTDIIQGTATTGGTSQINNTYGGFVTDGGPGANTIGLRGLGAGRTLVLINGRRVAPAGTRGAVGTADLNVLPNAMIDRIEVLRDGASSIYGSDAIAGVINVITRKDLEGLTVEGQYNRPQEGGGEQQRVSLTGGMAGDDWRVSASAEYYERENLTIRERDWALCPRGFRTDGPGGESLDYIDPLTGSAKCWGANDGGVTINTIGTNTRPGVPALGSTGVRFNRFRPNSAVTEGLIGFEGVTINSRDSFEDRMLNEDLISGAKIWTAYLEGSYDLHAMGNAEIYGEVLVNKRDSEQNGYRQLTLDYPVGSPFIPANLADSVALGPQPENTTNGENVGVRAFIGYGNDKSVQEVDYYKATGGIRGDLGLGDWKYDFTVSHADSDATYSFEAALKDRLGLSNDVVLAPAGFTGPTRGGYTCAINITSPGANCVPMPFLNNQTLKGELPEDFKNYVWQTIEGRTKYQETVFTFNVDGSVVELWDGNKVSGAFGVEYRMAEIDDTPSIESINSNLLNFTASAPTRGDDSVFEAYGELDIPLLKGLPGAELLSINVSGRYTDYESYGSDWTYKVGGLYSPFEWVSLRATYGTSFRAPALFEQYQGATSGFLGTASDPCNDFGNELEAGSIRYNNCLAEGLDPSFVPTQGIAVVTSGGAGSGQLAAETSDNLTVGIVFNFDMGEEYGKLSAAIDYYDIEVKNGVSQVGSGAIIDLCYDDPDFRAGGGFCNLISARNPGGSGFTIFDSYTNIATQGVKGLDYNVRYEADVYGGRVLMDVSLTQYLEQPYKLFPTDPIDDPTGTLNSPEFTATFDISYEYEGFRLRYGFEWIDAMDSTEYVGLDPATTTYDLDVPQYWLHNLSVRYENEDAQWGVVFGVRNLFDEEPPVISSGVYNRIINTPLYSGYEYEGREFFLNLTKTF